MSKVPFIKHDEHVFIIYQNGEHEGYAGIISTVGDVAELLHGTEGAVRVIRFDEDALKGEDISEEVASAYINAHGIVSDHPFIEHSQHYQNLLDDLEHEERNDRIYGTYEQQNRLSPSQML